MARVVKLAVGVVIGALALLVGSGLLIGALVSGSRKDALVGSLEKSAGVRLAVGAASFDLGQWLLLRPSLALENVKVGNPPGFRSASLLEAKKLRAQVGLLSLLGQTVEVNSIAIEAPRVTVEKNRAGASNLEVFLQGLSAKGAAPAPGASKPAEARGVSIESLDISDGEVRFLDAETARGPATVQAIEIALRDFAPGRACRMTAGAKLYGNGQSQVKFEGGAGPFGPASIPVSGTLRAVVAPGEIPPAVRREQFGDLLAAPGSKARLSLDVTVKGDLYGELGGPARLTIADLMVGRDAQHQLPLSGEAPAQWTIRKMMSAPAVRLQVPDATLRLASGQWKGGAEVTSDGTALRGQSHGSIHGVDINQFLSSLTTAEGKVFGQLDMPSYTLSFAGKDADQIQRSLAGNGSLEISKGRLHALDLIGSINRAVGGAGQSASSGTGSTEFTTLKAALNVGGEQLKVSDLQIESPAGRFTGSGSISFNQALSFHLDAVVTGRVAQLLGKQGTADQPAQATVPMEIAGTVSSPSVRPNVGKLAVGTGLNYLERLLQKKKQ